MMRMIRELWVYLRRQADLEPERRKLWFPVLFGVGIGLYYLLPQEPSKWLTLGIIESLILAAIILRYRPKMLKFLLILGLIIGGFSWVQLRSIYIASQMGEVPEQKLYLKGNIIKVDHSQKGKLRLTMDNLSGFEGEKIKGRFRITLRQKEGDYHAGQCVEMVATLLPRAKAQLPQGYQFDRKNFYNGLSGSGYAESRAFVVDCQQGLSLGDKLKIKIDNWRQKIISKVDSVLPAEEASIVGAILAGEQGAISEEQIKNYRDSGLAHFLSISGLHMSMIAGLMFFFIRLLLALYPPLALRYDSKKIAAVFAIIISTIYLLISGAAIPAQRAFIMTLIVLLGVLFNRRAISMYTIAWAAFIVLLITPEALIGASFQMSFAAVVGLIAFYEKNATRLAKWFKKDKSSLLITFAKSMVVYLAGIIIADLVASVAVLPFEIYHFNQISVYSLLANLAAGPIIGFIIMPFTLFSLILMPLGLDAYSLQVVGVGVGLVNEITAYVSNMEGALLDVLSMPLWGLVLMVLGGLWLCLWERRWRWFGLLVILIGALSMVNLNKPDMLINEDGKVIAVKDNYDNLVILPVRGKDFTKQIWLEKTASQPLAKNKEILLKKIYQGKATAPKWLDLSCDRESCLYKQRVKILKNKEIKVDEQNIDLTNSHGIAVYLDKRPKIISVRDYIGNRLWNK